MPEPSPGEVAVADAHGDLLLEVEYRHGRANPFGELWLDQLRRGGVVLQVCALWVGERQQEGALRLALRQLLAAQRAVRQNPELVLVTGAADLDAVAAGGRIGIVLALEGAEPLGADPELIDVFWQLGVRIVGLTWAARNAFADGNAEPDGGGLSRRGEALVARLAELGALVDLAHASPRTFGDVLAAAPELAVLVSHSGCRALHDDPRNVSDEQLRALRERDGIVGMMAHPLALGPGAPTRARLLDHVDHALAVAGPEGVCLGGDFARQVTRSGGLGLPWEEMRFAGGVEVDGAIEGLEGPAGYPRLLAELGDRGHPDAVVRGVASANLLRLLRRALP